MSPYLGSEAGNSWLLACTFENRKIPITFIVSDINQLGSENYKLSIQKEASNFKYVNFIFCPYSIIERKISKFFANFLFKKNPVGNPFIYGLIYKRWLKRAHSFAINISTVKIIHLLNHISFRWPLYSYFKINPDIKYFWGPVSGCVKINISYTLKYSLGSLARSLLTNLFIWYSKRNNNIKNFASLCSKIYVVSPDDMEYLSDFNENIQYQLDIYSLPSFNTFKKIRKCNILNILFVGRLDDRKGLDLALEAVRGMDNVHLTIAGSGAYEDFFKNLCRKLSLNNVSFIGNVPRDHVFTLFQSADVLLHPSIREAGSTVILEAMSHSLPVICHKSFGMASFVSDLNGFPFPLINPASSVKYIRSILFEIIENPSVLDHKSIFAYETSKNLTAHKFVDYLLSDYTQSLL